MQAGAMVATGDADGAVAGCVRTTADVVRAALVTIGLDTGFDTLSSAFYMVFDADHPAGPSVLTFTDAGVVPHPTAAQLAEIGHAAATARERVVGDEPRVAFLSYSTLGSSEGPTVTTMREALSLFRTRAPDVAADGELQGDTALSETRGASQGSGIRRGRSCERARVSRSGRGEYRVQAGSAPRWRDRSRPDLAGFGASLQ